jgi:hypothetical protein
MGSDDALRLWLNGELIGEGVALRPATRDSESTKAQLGAGENVLLVEVSQGVGEWGLALRIDAADGADLPLMDNGQLAPIEQVAAALLRFESTRATGEPLPEASHY